MATQNNGLPHKPIPTNKKHMANDHIHVQTKFSNKSINHTVETGLIHTNTETHHICLTYILLKAQHSPQKKCILIIFFIYRLIYIFFLLCIVVY